MPLPTRIALAALAASLPAQGFTPPTPLPGDDAVSASSGNQSNPRVALGAGTSLVVWQDDRSSLIDSVFGGQAIGSSIPGNFDIYGVLIDAAGRPLTQAPILINGDSWDQVNPRVAWNGVEYLVVFESMRPTPNYRSVGIYGVRVTANGTVRDTTPIQIYDHPDAEERFPVVASANGSWLVGFSDTSASASLEGALVSAAGTVGTKRVLVSAPVGSPPSNAQLASDGSRYVLVYSVAFGPQAHMARFDAAGNPLGAPLTLTTSSGLLPAVGASAAGFYVAWAGAGVVRGSPLDPNLNLLIAGGALLGTTQSSQMSGLGVGHDGVGWTVAYDQNPLMYAVKVDAQGAVTVPATGFALSVRSLSHAVVGNGNGRTPILWTDHRLTGQFGIDIADVFGATIDTLGVTTAEQPLTISTPSQVYARIAGDPAVGYLIVYASLTSGGKQLSARHVDAWGRPSAAQPFAIHVGTHALGFPDVACNGREFVVTWHELQSTTNNGPPPLVFCRRCRTDGTLLDAAPVRVMEGTAPCVDAVGDTFLVAARYHHITLQSTSVVRGRRLSGASGAFLEPSPIVVQLGASGQTDVVGLQDRWLVAWGSLTASFVRADGTVVGSFHAADTGSTGTRFMLAANEGRDEAVVAYQYYSSAPHRTDVHVRRIRVDGTSPDPLLGPQVSGANQAQLRPTIASLDGEYLTLWADHRNHLDYEPGIGDVYAARLTTTGTLLDPTGIGVLGDPFGEGAAMAQRTGRGRAMLVMSDLHDGAYRLVVGAYHGADAQPWRDEGRGVPGVRGVPLLDGYGSLRASTVAQLSLWAGPAHGAGALVLGTAAVNVPLFGGVFVPRPDLVLGLGLDAQGAWSLNLPWPAGVPRQSATYFQAWLADAAATQGLSASNGLRSTAP